MRYINKLTTVFVRHKVLTRAISFVLTLALLFCSLPLAVFAAEIESAEGADSNAADTASTGTAPVTGADGTGTDTYEYDSDVYEVEELREVSVKHFRLEDGSYVAAQYGYPVHYYDNNGALTDIDNTLAEDGSGFIANSTARIKLQKKITGNGSLFTLHDGNTKITLSLEGARKGTVGVITNFADNENDTKLGKMMNLERLAASVKYEEILDGVDIEYVVESLSVKENIIVKEPQDGYTYTFELKLNNLSARAEDDGSVSIINDSGECVYTIPAPIAFDAVGAYSPVGTATQTLEGKNNKYTLTVSVDPEWMNSEERAYPITVDPALYYMLDPYGTAVQDTFIGDETVLGYLGYLAIDSTMAAYWRTSQLPELPEDAVNYGVKLCIDYNSSSGRFMPVLQLKEVTSDWSEATLTAANVSSVSVDSDVIAYTGIDQYFKYCWDITELAGKWYDDPTTNFGVQIIRDMTADSLYHGVPGATVRLNSKESPAYTGLSL